MAWEGAKTWPHLVSRISSILTLSLAQVALYSGHFNTSPHKGTSGALGGCFWDERISRGQEGLFERQEGIVVGQEGI